MLGIGDFLWRLLPANPILLRVIAVGGKRMRDLVVRCIYLGLLVAIVLAVTFSSDSSSGQSLAQLNITSSRIFEQLSYLQLAFVALLAPIFTAGAITQEKDSQTYDILLSTPLSNAQIVLGSLLSRLFFVFTLLLSGIPIFSITQIFGGVAIGDILLSVLIAAVTALTTGALAIAIATFKVGTRRTIFSFYLFNIIYLVGFFLLDTVPQLKIPLVDAAGAPAEPSKLSWLTGLHPFLALRVVLDPTNYPAPGLAQLPSSLRWWPLAPLATSPVAFFLWSQTLFSLLLICPAILLLRRLAQSSSTVQSTLQRFLPFRKADQGRKPRAVWNNPIAWREASTKASASRSTLLRYGFILCGLLAAIVLTVGYSREVPPAGKWIDVGSYKPASGTLLVRGENTTYGVDEKTKVMILNAQGREPRQRGADLLHRRFNVELLTYRDIRSGPNAGSRFVTQINLRPIERQISTETARRFLLGLVIVEVCAILLIITNAAASTVTREKEDGTLDLLLATPITSRYYIWGKVRGLVSYVLPLLSVPIASMMLFVIIDLVRGAYDPGDGLGPRWIVLPEALLALPGMLVVAAAFASIVGMQMSLRLRTTVWAVMASVGVVLGASGALGWCGYALLNSGVNAVTAGVASFSPFTTLMMMISPEQFGQNTPISRRGTFGGSYNTDPKLLFDQSVRLSAFIFTLIATACYAGVVWTMYTSMVKNFDMTIRKQSR